MRGRLGRRWLGRKRDFDREAREWMNRLCAPPRSAPRWWSLLRWGGRGRPVVGWGRLIAFLAIGAAAGMPTRRRPEGGTLRVRRGSQGGARADHPRQHGSLRAEGTGRLRARSRGVHGALHRHRAGDGASGLGRGVYALQPRLPSRGGRGAHREPGALGGGFREAGRLASSPPADRAFSLGAVRRGGAALPISSRLSLSLHGQGAPRACAAPEPQPMRCAVSQAIRAKSL